MPQFFSSRMLQHVLQTPAWKEINFGGF